LHFTTPFEKLEVDDQGICLQDCEENCKDVLKKTLPKNHIFPLRCQDANYPSKLEFSVNTSRYTTIRHQPPGHPKTEATSQVSVDLHNGQSVAGRCPSPLGCLDIVLYA
jgi:hypothetical protein